MVVIFFISMALPALRDLNFNECLILMKIRWLERGRKKAEDASCFWVINRLNGHLRARGNWPNDVMINKFHRSLLKILNRVWWVSWDVFKRWFLGRSDRVTCTNCRTSGAVPGRCVGRTNEQHLRAGINFHPACVPIQLGGKGGRWVN